jgi:GNAT superfamily N-acetyltransferase
VTLPPDLIVRRAEPDDVPGILALFRVVFGRDLSPERYLWKVRGLSSWPGHAWVAASGAEIVSHYGCTPVRMTIEGRTMMAAHGSDAMTHPRFRRHGVMTALQKAALAAWSEAGFALAYALPTGSTSVSGTESAYGYKPGWASMFPLQWVRQPLRFDRLLARRVRVPSAVAATARTAAWAYARWFANVPQSSDITVSEVSTANADLDAIWTRVAQSIHASVVRDREWVQRRYLSDPDRRYRLLVASDGKPIGFAVWKMTADRDRSTGWIVDLCARTTQGASALVAAIVSYCRREGADDIRAVVPRAGVMQQLLRAHGFLRASGGFQLFAIALAPWIDLPALANPERWHVSGGDFDVV